MSIKILIFIILFSLNLTNVFSAEKTVFIDIEKIIQLSNSGKPTLEKLKEIQLENQNKIKIHKKKILTEEEDIKKLKNIITEEEFKRKINILKKNINQFNKDNEKRNYEFNKMKSEFLVEQMKIITPLVKQYMEENNISIVLDKKNIFIANSDQDITNDIIKILNKNE